jgi:hypothetical protein
MEMKAIFGRAKKATVAIAIHHGKLPQRPYSIIGSGVCIHSQGIVITCEHVLSAFFEKSIPDQVSDVPRSEWPKTVRRLPPVEHVRPHAIFFVSTSEKNTLFVYPVPVIVANASLTADIAVLKIQQHPAFPDGYPTIDIEEFSDLYEGIEAATCGFPLGDVLGEKLGTMTSSFSRGILSSFIPGPSVTQDLVRGFQLDLTTNPGNSGGPVFSVSNGRVFGIVQGGLIDQNRISVPGITKAEPIYPALEIVRDILASTR